MTTTEKHRILVTVKTYPTLSRKYGETVCTAGVREDGTWLRIYPVPFRRLDEEEQYRKFDWIECRLKPRASDPRPESFSSEALAKVRDKYYQEFLRTDLHFFLGTTQQFHQVGPNPWVVAGVFPIPHDPQQRLFDQPGARGGGSCP